VRQGGSGNHPFRMNTLIPTRTATGWPARATGMGQKT
jgi:hypothetical protein